MAFKKTNPVHRFCALALVVLLGLAGAGCGGGDGAKSEAPVVESLTAARERAAEAAQAAREAYIAALTALNGANAYRAADPDSYARAALRVADARAAWEAAMAAERRAREAASAADARRHADTAETEEEKARRAYAEAERYAGMVREASDALTRRTKNARLFESANGAGAATPGAARARVGTVAALTAEAVETGRILATSWDLTTPSDDDATTETQGTNLSVATNTNATTAAIANWAVDDRDPRLRVRVGTGVGTSTVLDTEKAAGATPTNEQRLLPRVGTWTEFQGVELSAIEGGLYAHAYTDIAQTRTIPAQNAASVRSVPVLLTMIPESLTVSTADQAAGSFAGGYDHDGDPDTDPLVGTFSCPEGRACSLDTDGEGRIVAISGYTFTGAGPARPEREAPDEDYLVFGVWLYSPALLPSVGAFASGNAPFEAGTGGVTLRVLEGTAIWRGPATGIHATSEANRPFDATATLSANFGDATSFGRISGTIGNIVSGGETVADSIVLIEAPLIDYAAAGYFQGAARMGEAEDPTDAVPTYPYNGQWGGRFYGPGATGSGYPGSAAGVFGVSGGEDSDRQSFVGAFGAHRQP